MKAPRRCSQYHARVTLHSIPVWWFTAWLDRETGRVGRGTKRRLRRAANSFGASSPALGLDGRADRSDGALEHFELVVWNTLLNRFSISPYKSGLLRAPSAK